MKRILFTFIFATMTLSAMAQIDFGPRINLTSTKLSLKENIADVSSGDAAFGYQLGAFLRVKIPIVGLYVQPEALFSNPSAQVTVATEKIDLNFSQIDVPVMVGIKLGPVRLNAGPSFRFVSKVDAKDPNGTIEDIKDEYKNSTVGYQAGVGVDILKMVIDLKYEGSLGTIAEGSNLVTDQRINQWVFGVGFKLF